MRILARETREICERGKAMRVETKQPASPHRLPAPSSRLLFAAFACFAGILFAGCASPRAAERSRGLAAKECYLATRYHDTYRANAELDPAASRLRVAEPTYANVQVEEWPLDARDVKAQLVEVYREARSQGKDVLGVWPSHGRFVVVTKRVKP